MASKNSEEPNKRQAGDTQIAMGNDTDPDLGILRTIFKHPVILLCCIYANIGALMYGFDNITLSLCLSMQPFIEQFGTVVGDTLIIPAYWQSLWNALPQLTTGLGAWASGPIADRFGRRVSFGVAGLISVAGVAVIYTASSNGAFLAGKMVNSFSLGMALTTGQIYVSEITPLKLRGVALAGYTLSMNLGFLVAASIAFKRVTIPDQSAYKVVFAAEWVWPALMLLLSPIIPESPYYLARKNKIGAATRSLSILYSKQSSVQPILQSITSIIQHEQHLSESSFRDCFKGINWRRTRIVLYANGLSQMIGATFIANAPYFMIVAGMSPTNTAMMVELGIGLAIISSVFTFRAMTSLGRRTMVLSGTAFAGLLFFIMGVASSIPQQSSASLWCTGITLQLVWLSIGPAIGPAMSVAGEVSAVRLRAKTSALGFFFNYTFSTIWNVVVPYMFNPDQGNLAGKMGWIFFATCVIAGVIVWLEIPETKDLSFAEIDERFEMRVSAREFNTWRDLAQSSKDMELGQVEQMEHVNS
ncbi:general substrate transporter [Diplogelasinospora grovesii]|uniref:General substrate transporter n=1 Tax=Diplogelasinospora grovesii TaxID=303347 RepID=A0AAN6S962_9PEZI|nr:general substrate transporter [Diplogelasinospora grovesii]